MCTHTHTHTQTSLSNVEEQSLLAHKQPWLLSWWPVFSLTVSSSNLLCKVSVLISSNLQPNFSPCGGLNLNLSTDSRASQPLQYCTRPKPLSLLSPLPAANFSRFMQKLKG